MYSLTTFKARTPCKDPLIGVLDANAAEILASAIVLLS